MKHTAGKRILCMLLLSAILSGCAAENESVLQNSGTTPTSASVSPTQATGTECTNPDEVTKATDAAEPTDPTSPTDPTEPAPTGTTQTEPEPTEPAPTEPEPTEPKPTEPKPTEPKPTEPKPTEPKPTEPTPTEPKPTEPPTEPEPEPTEPPTEPEPTEYIDIAALIEYGHQYGKEKWGFVIDTEMGLHGDPVGYFPPDYRRITTMEDGRYWMRENIDDLAEVWIAHGEPVVMELPDGTISRMRLRIGIEPEGDGWYWIYAYYG